MSVIVVIGNYLQLSSPLTAITPGISPNSGRRGGAGFKNFPKDLVNVGFDFFVPKSNDWIAKLFKLARPLFILFSLQVVEIAVNLHHQSFFTFAFLPLPSPIFLEREGKGMGEGYNLTFSAVNAFASFIASARMVIGKRLFSGLIRAPRAVGS